MTGIYDLKKRLLIEEATKWVGITEEGNNKGAKVEEFQKAVDGKAQGEPWCLSFLQYCVKKVDETAKTLFEGELPENWLYQTEHCLTLWNKTPKEARLKNPEPGALIIWQYWNGGKPTSSGHVGIITSISDDRFLVTIEGNTSPSAEVVREGDGVYQKNRAYISTSKTMKVVGFLAPWDPNKNFHVDPIKPKEKPFAKKIEVPQTSDNAIKRFLFKAVRFFSSLGKK